MVTFDQIKNMKLKLIALLFSVFIANLVQAEVVDTVLVFSNKMKREIKCVVIKPENYNKKTALPVVYLLHGYSGKYDNWITKVAALKNYATSMNLLIVCPDGGFSSWYFDSPIDSTYQYETFVSSELVTYIDANYSTIKNANARALTGLSMGGHGGIYVGLQHPQVFGAIGSMSGALDVTFIKSNYQVDKRLGDTINFANNWKTHSTFSLVDTIKDNNQKIIIDCGTEDFVLAFNEEIHKRLMKRKIKHDYILRPGKHDWNYWANAVYFQLAFFKKYFEEGRK
jgi:S-formylglutathione hydrolase FrmB